MLDGRHRLGQRGGLCRLGWNYADRLWLCLWLLEKERWAFVSQIILFQSRLMPLSSSCQPPCFMNQFEESGEPRWV